MKIKVTVNEPSVKESTYSSLQLIYDCMPGLYETVGTTTPKYFLVLRYMDQRVVLFCNVYGSLEPMDDTDWGAYTFRRSNSRLNLEIQND